WQGTTADIAKWRAVLHKIADSGLGLGERSAEGFGRFAVDLDVHDPDCWPSQIESKIDVKDDSVSESPMETILARVERFCERHSSQLRTLTPSQLNWLRMRAMGESSVEEVIHELEDRCERKVVSDKWKPIIPTLRDEMRSISRTNGA